MQWFAQMVAITGDVDAAVLMAVQFVANYITYTTDLLLYGVTDYWTDPLWTLYKGSGDCEDGSILLTSILINLDCPVTSIKVAIGTYNSIGHSWVLYKRESDGLNVLLDWTKGSAYWNTISSLDELPVAYTEE
jgi:predicted transglutaminase-like cysteine proteinase